MKTVLIFGSFDILHYGHVHMFKHAREHGDKVVAVVATDVNMRKHKEIDPFHSEDERLEILKNISLIDDVRLGDKSDVYKVVNDVKPDVIALGYDQRIFVDELARKITEFGLDSQIVRLPSYKPGHYKTSNIRQYLTALV
jgi:cytidyltransferase-like protein